MPKQIIDYSKTIIYKIVPNDLNLPYCYVGHSTCFNKRKQSHKVFCNNHNQIPYNYKIYQTIRNNGGWDEWQMVLVEEFPCDNRLQAAKRERYWYEELNGNLNSNVPNQNKQDSQKNWEKNNPEYFKQYVLNNKEKLNEKFTCECGGKYARQAKSTHFKTKKHLKFFSNNIVNASDKTEETETL